MTNSKGKKRRTGSKSLSSITRCSDPKFIDFIDRCLDWDPARRMKPAKALKHPFIIDMVKKASISSLEMDCQSYTQVSSAEEKTPLSSLERKTKNLIRKFPSSTTFLRAPNAPQIQAGHVVKNKLPSVASLEKWKSSFLASKEHIIGRKLPYYGHHYSKPSTASTAGNSKEGLLPPINVSSSRSLPKVTQIFFHQI